MLLISSADPRQDNKTKFLTLNKQGMEQKHSVTKLKVTAIIQKTKQTLREPCFTERAEHKYLMFNFPVITASKWAEAKVEKIVPESKLANKKMESGGVLN